MADDRYDEHRARDMAAQAAGAGMQPKDFYGYVDGLFDAAKADGGAAQAKTERERRRERLNRIISLSLAGVMMFLTLIMFFVPTISSRVFSISPADFITSDHYETLFEGVEPIIVTYYVSQVFFIIFAALYIAVLALIIHAVVKKKKNIVSLTMKCMTAVLMCDLVAMLIGISCLNVFTMVAPGLEVTAYSPVFFFLSLAVLIAKFVSDIVLGEEKKDELKYSGVSLVSSFLLTALTIGLLITPIYILPGTPFRMHGIDILLGRPDELSGLQMQEFSFALIIIFLVTMIICFAANLVLFLTERRVFIHFNKFVTFLGITGLFIYAFTGLNYIVAYLDAAAYAENIFFNTSVNTYSYIPLSIYIIFAAGSAFMKMATSKMNVEYKVYAKPEDIKKTESKRPLAQQAPAAAGGTAADAPVPDPIAAFSELDGRVEMFTAQYVERRTKHLFADLTLPKLVTHIIEYARHSKERLSYGPTEIKTFIAGIAASRLSILQGMSGTGKTSLPKIFMEAIDGFCEIVAVESSWRDKNELLGYYNEFSRKYTPKSFTQFLYKAALNKDVPYFIVLDEMNLSRIEYYFSDFLSLMEMRENMRQIKLFDVQLYPNIDERENYLALRDGHTLDIPTNVWFIGTANRDESTFEISDKVYDRAQTMNFDKRAPKAPLPEQAGFPKKFVPYSMLRTLFDRALSAKFNAENYDPIRKAERILRPYNISFGNRVLNQIEDFVKAYVACSEAASAADRSRFVHEAVDCIMLSKVVRKLELKQITEFDSLISEFEALRFPKCAEFIRSMADTAE